MMKKKTKAKENEMSDQKQRVDSSIENVGSEHAERGRDAGQYSKSNKIKQKRKHDMIAAKGFAHDEILKSKDNKTRKEHSVVLEEESQIYIIKMGENIKREKKRRMGSDNANPYHSDNATSRGEVSDVDGKNDKKKKIKNSVGEESGVDCKNDKKKRKSKHKIGEESDEDSKNDKEKRKSGHKIGEESYEDRKNNKEKKKREQKIGEESDVDGKNDKKKRKSDHKIGEESDIDGKNDKKKRKSEHKIGEESDVDGKNDKKKGKGKQKIEERREKEKAIRYKEKGKRVSFADDVQVFSIDGPDDEEVDRSSEPKIVHGQRFTLEEDATLMKAIMEHIEMKQLGERGLDMIRLSSRHPELRGCWAHISKSLPHRPKGAIYNRAQILLYRSDERKWTREEYERIRQFVETNGKDWKTLALELGKSNIHVKDTWRRIKLKNMKKGSWTQDEYQKLFDLVNLDLRVKAHQESITDNRLLRDNISWEAISDKLATRNHKNCCLKWYQQLASPLVKQGIWTDSDDYRLIKALQKVDSVCVEDVDWENLLEHRSGEVCRRRWNQMVRNIGGHKEKPFIEQVEVLSKRYCPEMLAYRN